MSEVAGLGFNPLGNGVAYRWETRWGKESIMAQGFAYSVDKYRRFYPVVDATGQASVG